MILLAGLPDEPPLARVATALDDLGIAYRMIDQRRHADMQISFNPAGMQGVLQGHLRCKGEDDIKLEDVTAVYQRLHCDASFPDLGNLPQNHPLRVRFGRFVTLFTVFTDLCSGRVLNRTPGMGTNNSKPFQAQIITQCGFDIPRTLITNIPKRAQEFVHEIEDIGRDVIVKELINRHTAIRNKRTRCQHNLAATLYVFV